jgi:predicted glycoside hydrolase/deacetylase ChbG (UPF0249 family)
MRYMFANADDLGMCPGVNEGILEALLKGNLASASLMVCEPHHLPECLSELVSLQGRVGCHLQLTDGTPCSAPDEIPSLVNDQGKFPRGNKCADNVSLREILREWHAQMSKILETRVRPTHIDTHHHVHRLPVVLDAYAEVALYYGLPARTHDIRFTRELRRRGVRCAELCVSTWCSEGQSIENLLAGALAATAKISDETVFELVCHPGYVDSNLASRSKYVHEREKELALLLSGNLEARLKAVGIQLISREAASAFEHCRKMA